jgi:hypothetical protein
VSLLLGEPRRLHTDLAPLEATEEAVEEHLFNVCQLMEGRITKEKTLMPGSIRYAGLDPTHGLCPYIFLSQLGPEGFARSVMPRSITAQGQCQDRYNLQCMEM